MAEIHPITKPVQWNCKNRDLTGQVFGRWTVLKLAGRNARQKLVWQCECQCGAVRYLPSGDLKDSRSCGCFSREQTGNAHRTHGLSKSDEYRIWTYMVTRCYNPNDHAFKNYGARGITICRRWRNSFEAFLSDLGKRPSHKHSIERCNNEEGYNCGNCEDCHARNVSANCRWATRTEQNRNRRDTEFLTYHGETLPLVTLAERFRIKTTTLRNRLKNGWPVADALETPASAHNKKRLRSRSPTATK